MPVVPVMVMPVMMPPARQNPVRRGVSGAHRNATGSGGGFFGIGRRQRSKADGDDEGADEFVHKQGIKQ
jgi:hypothetical protein